ncbi:MULTISPECIES: sugar transferase [Bacillus cereus group]|uniref:Galactosyl transferase CpsE n=1 Tax=Bacillus cereus (strain G9842) TaxID=405531 RepID=B7IQS5_BACC2|nr:MULTISPECIES: sugar transferase [Bacillus cereus group]ACK97341.1 galactosyl transferase CpsE [Bacillus cereus G9842]KAB2420073.1 sugar transferase [Bacillus cereus]MDR4134916.1 sugar transferase [Bacillus cereus]MDR4366889.1 sugar transferase [Bacillus cereus]MED2486640.1 sugar transferase [Bacillus thuringiensis]
MNLVKVSENKLKKEANEILVCEQVPVRKGYILAKRCMDFMGALCGLIILSPVFLMVAILIKYEDPKGPVFFKQIRMGKNGRNFYMYKFRSMVTDAEKRLEDLLIQNEVSGAMFKMKDDPRVTKIGKFIRRTSIDELPQLINVLKGEMSLVGPRPPLPREVQEYTNYDRQRLMVKPGCTGIWQISGRSSLSFAEMVELDIEYIINRNLILDFKIIIKTVGVMLFDKNAY